MSTIYLTAQDVKIEIKDSYFKVFYENEQRICLPIRNISQLIIFGNIHLPQNIIKAVYSHQIPTLYLTQSGEYLGRLENPSQAQPKYLSYQRQHLRNLEFNRTTAESMIWAKLHNQQVCLQSWTRHHVNNELQRGLNYLTLLMDNLSLAKSIDELHGYSEEADHVYYCAITSMINFYSRCPHTGAKQIKALLNLGYQLLHQYIYTLLKTIGLHPDYAILHSNNHHELPLAWDFTTEFSALVVDDLVLNFAHSFPNLNGNGNGKNHQQSFIQHFLQHWEAKLRTFVLHPYAGEVSYRQCMDLQVREYLACLVGDIEFYRPLAFKHHPTHSHFTNIPERRKAPLTLAK